MKATTTSVGMVQLSTSASATDPNAAALSVTEKNASMSGSIMNQVNAKEADLQRSITSVAQNLTSGIRNSESNISTLFTLMNRFTQTNGAVAEYRGNIDDIGLTSIYNCSREATAGYPPLWTTITWYFIITLTHVYTNAYRVQIAITMCNDLISKPIARRQLTNGYWSAWQYLTMTTS